MKKTVIHLIVCLSVMVFLHSCGSDSKPTTAETSKKEEEIKAPVMIPTFSADLAYDKIASQVAFGPRNPNTEAHQKTKQWIIDELKSLGLKVNTQTFRANTFKGEKYTGTNIIGHYKPEYQNRILLLAHWDTRFMADMEEGDLKNKPIPGADDGGSGVGVLLALANLVVDNEVNVGIDFLFLDAEDQGEDGGGNPESWCQGAQYYASNMMISSAKPQFGILLDMVGAKDAVFMKEEISMTFAGHIMHKVWAMAQGMGYGRYFSNQKTTAALDDHFFINRTAGIPTIDIIYKNDAGFGKHWHTHSDNMDIIDKKTLQAVGQVVTAVIYNYAAGNF